MSVAVEGCAEPLLDTDTDTEYSYFSPPIIRLCFSVKI